MKYKDIKMLKENDLDWVYDLVNKEYFEASPEMLNIGTEVFINGVDRDDADDGLTPFNNRGVIIDIKKYSGNDVILVKFEDWKSPESLNIISSSSPLWDGKSEECRNNDCWSFMRDYKSFKMYDEYFEIIIPNDYYKPKLKEENDLDDDIEWVRDILYPDMVELTPEDVNIGMTVWVDGVYNSNKIFNNLKGVIIDKSFNSSDNEIILISFENWHGGGTDYSSYFSNHDRRDCSGNRCWSLRSNKEELDSDDDYTIYFENPNRKKHLKEEVVRQELNIELPKSIISMNQIFKQNGHQLYVVGGAVRDALLKNEPKDFDLATDATPDEIKSMLKRYRTIDVGEQFGIVNVVTEDGQYELATFRTDIGKGRRPDAVEFTTIDQDVKRRDLTINALFYDIDKGEIVDLVGGINDLQSNVIRTVGSASERFDEDKLRILRALRFAARVGSELDKDIEDAITKDKTPVSGNGLSLSQERIRDEFLKGISQAQSVGYFTQKITKYNLWDWIFGRLVVTTEPLIETKNYIVLIATLLKGNDPSLVERTLIKDLKYTSEEGKQIAFLIQFLGLNATNAFKLREKFDVIRMDDSTLIEFAKFNEMKLKNVEAFLKYRITTSGEDLIAQGFRGRDIGREKERLEKERFEKLMTESKKKIAYSGIVLTEKSRSELLKYITAPEGWELLADHMTINMGALKEEYRPLLGQSFDLVVTHVGETDNVMAVKVDTQFKTKNLYPHITIAIDKNNGGKPALSNNITEWKPINPIEVEGRLQEVQFGK